MARSRSRLGIGRVVLAGVATVAFFLAIYPVQRFETPLGFDTARYLWRNHCVASGGLDALEGCRPPLTSALPGRPAYPSVTLPLTSLLGGEGAVASAFPGALAATIGLAAGALLTRVSGRGGSALALAAILVGTSVMVVRLAGPEGYADNMLALALGLGGMALALGLDRSANVAGAALLGAAALTHWPTAALLAVVLAGTGLAGSRPFRGGADPRELKQIGLILVLAGIVWGVTVALLGAGPEPFFADPVSLRAKVRSDLAAYVLPVTIPLAALGALLVPNRDRHHRLLERMLLVWIGVIAAATAVWILVPSVPRSLRSIGPGIPLHRVLAFALPLPILTTLGLLSLPSALRRAPRAAAWALVLAGVVLSAGIGARLWWRNEPDLDPNRLREAAVAAAYLEAAVPANLSVIVPMDRVEGNPMLEVYQAADTLRVALAPERLDDLVVYVGTPDRMLEGKPTLTGDPAFDAASLFRWPPVRRALDEPHVTLLLESLSTDPVSGDAVGPGVRVLETTTPSSLVRPTPPHAIVAPAVVPLAGLALLAALGLAGSGWAAASGGRTFERVALAPAFGIGAILFASLLADVAGVRIAGATGMAVAISAGALGWATLVLRRRFPARPNIPSARPGAARES